MHWVFFCIVSLCFACTVSQTSPQIHSAQHIIRGVSLGLFSQDPLWDYDELICEISAVGASDILIVIPFAQETIYSSNPVLQIPIVHIQKIVEQAKSRGMHVSLMPMIQLSRRGEGMWRGVLQPEDAQLWWSNYRALLFQLAVLAHREQVQRLYIGSELCSLEGDIDSWKSIIEGIRKRYSGRVGYSANWDHYQEVGFWSLLDEISITEYSPIRGDVQKHWQQKMEELSSFASHKQRPFLISEYGYPSIRSAAQFPWDETHSTDIELGMQEQLVKGAMSVLYAQKKAPSNFQGAFYWNWFGFGGSSDGGFSPRGKPVQEVMKMHFRTESEQ